MQILYKIVPAALWSGAVDQGVFRGSPADLQDGFIHLSTAQQMRETAAKHFAGQDGLVLVGFREDDLSNLKWETSRGGDLFPHVYGTICTGLVHTLDPLPFENGVHSFPTGAV